MRRGEIVLVFHHSLCYGLACQASHDHVATFKSVSDNETEQTRTDMSASYDTFLAPAVAFLTPELQKDGILGSGDPKKFHIQVRKVFTKTDSFMSKQCHTILM